jgi:hypothetical protein
MPPGVKKSWRFGRFSGGAGMIEMGAGVDIGGWSYPMIVGWVTYILFPLQVGPISG